MGSEDIQEISTLAGPWGPVFYQGRVDSTNTWAKRCAESGEKGPRVFMAGAQGQGRGRLGRVWHSPPEKSLYLSMLVGLQRLPMSRAPLLTLAIALAAQGALEEFGIEGVLLKWPNDIVVERESKGKSRLLKLGGVLAEVVTPRQSPPQIILGLGLNLNHGEDDLPADLQDIATSLYMLTGKKATDLQVAFQVLSRAQHYIRALETDSLEGFMSQYEKACLTLGRRVAFEIGGIFVDGRAVGLTKEATLIVEDVRGKRHIITAGDVRIRD